MDLFILSGEDALVEVKIKHVDMYYFSVHKMLIILMCFVYWLYVNVTLIVTWYV